MLLLVSHVYGGKGHGREDKSAKGIYPFAEQKFEIVRDIERHATVKEGLQKYQIADSLYGNGNDSSWSASGAYEELQARKIPRSEETRRREQKTERGCVLNQSLMITNLKKR